MDEKFLSILSCPVCKGDLKMFPNKKGLKCQKCGHEYPIKDDVPVLLPYD